MNDWRDEQWQRDYEEALAELGVPVINPGAQPWPRPGQHIYYVASPSSSSKILAWIDQARAEMYRTYAIPRHLLVSHRVILERRRRAAEIRKLINDTDTDAR